MGASATPLCACVLVRSVRHTYGTHEVLECAAPPACGHEVWVEVRARWGRGGGEVGAGFRRGVGDWTRHSSQDHGMHVLRNGERASVCTLRPRPGGRLHTLQRA